MILCIFSLLCVFLSIFSADTVITQPGIYEFGSDISFLPSGPNDSIVIIDSSDVILDLSGSILQQDNNVSNIRGIEVTAGQSNITIKNGTIENVTGAGISIADNCSNIQIQGIACINCQTRGIEIIGAGTTENCGISNCTILDSCSGVSGDFGIYLDNVARFQLQHCLINGCGNISNPFSGLYVNSCVNCDIRNISIISSIGSSIIGIDIESSLQCLFNQIMIRDSSVTAGGAFRGIDLHGTINQSHMFERCTVTSNSSTLDCIGFLLEANSQSNIFRECKALYNSGGSVDGFVLTGAIANNFTNSFVFCSASYNSATGVGNQANGWRIQGSNFGSVLNSIAAENTSANNIATGLTFISPGGNNWTIKGNQFNRNMGSSTANSFGVRRLVGTINLFQENNAFNNGTGSATVNQFAGVPGASVLAITTGNLNTFSRIGNIGIPN